MPGGLFVCLDTVSRSYIRPEPVPNCPEGTFENSPTFQRGESAANVSQVPQGRLRFNGSQDDA
jgi:hypothetical protein